MNSLSKQLSKAVASAATAVFFIGACLFCTPDMSAARKKTSADPDFAYPKTVIENADKALDAALSANDWSKAVVASIQYVTAQNLVSQENLTEGLHKIDSISKNAPADWRPALLLVEADIYSSLYSNIRGKADARQLPLDSFPANPKEWSRDMFADRVLSVCSDIIDSVNGLDSTPLSRWNAFLENSGSASECGMTVGEFILWKTAGLLDNFSEEDQDVIPFFSNLTAPATPTRKCRELRDKALNMYIEECAMRKQSLLQAKALALQAESAAYSLRSKMLLEALNKMKNTEGEQVILRSLHQYINTYDLYSDESPYLPSLSEYLEWIRISIREFPKGRYVNALKNILADHTEPSADVSFRNQYLSSADIKLDVTLKNCTRTWILVYDYSKYANATKQPSIKTMAANCRLVKAVEVSAEETAPFIKYTNVSVGQLHPGSYAVVASATPDAKGIYPAIADNRWFSPFTVSDIAIISFDCFDGSSRVLVVDGKDGRPIEGATVKVYTRKRYNTPQELTATLTTDKDGSVTTDESRAEIRAEFNGSKATSDIHVFSSAPSDSAKQLKAAVIADRSIYHPGDSVGAAVVAYTSQLRNLSLSDGTSFNLSLCDANGKEVAKQKVLTDKFGRAAADFRIPDEGLLGRWSVTAYDNDDKWLGNTSFQVADYVAPTFFITSDNSENEYETGDSVRLRGQVITYSGMPVADASVNFTVRYTPPMRWFCQSYASYSSSVATDSDGKYTITLPTGNLKDTQFERGVFSVYLSATSPAGETQEGSVQRFAIGREYTISTESSLGNFEISDSLPTLNFTVKDMLGRNVSREINYALINSATKDTVASGSFMSPTLRLPQKHYDSAEYDIHLSLADNKEVDLDSSFVFWRKSDAVAPAGTGLWIPRASLRPAPGETAVAATIGSGVADRWLPVLVSGDGKIVDFKWTHVDRDNLSVSLPTPAGKLPYTAQIAYISNLHMTFEGIDILPATPADTLGIETESFRNKISAGDEEHWKFRFFNRAGSPGQIPVMAVMTDAALNHIEKFRWNFGPFHKNHNRTSYMRIPWIGNSQLSLNMKNAKRLSWNELSFPSFNDYCQNWGLGFRVVNELYYAKASATSRGMAMQQMKLADSDGAVAENSIEAVAEEAEDLDLSDSLEGMAAGVTVLGLSAVAQSDGGDSATSPDSLRESEHPLAFFMPYLTSDADGVVDINFTVPNFNTTWQFQMIGYDESMQTAYKSLETVASKPVMVSTHAPRFVRTGDAIWLTATLFNNTDETCGVKGRIELVNLLNGRTIASREYAAEDVKARGNRIVAMDWTVPSDVSAVGFRAYAEVVGHRDGEQALLPVLPASSPVVESTPFWLAPGQKEFEIKLPRFKDSDQVTLQYCDNPAWYCLTALPDIMQTDSKSVTAKATALYGNAMAYNLISSDASLKKGLEALLSDKDSEFSALKSNLEKDGDLKIAKLSNTPWVNDAESETLRMSRLSTLIEKENAEKTIAGQIKELSALQTAEGGWSWCPDMQPSTYITRSVLSQFASLTRSGALTAFPSAEPMIKSAIRYVDDETWKDYTKYHKKDESLSWLLDWLYVRSSFDKALLPSGVLARNLSPVYAKAEKDIAKEWKNLDIRDKALAALLLWRSGNRKTALDILESLTQFASVSPEKGVWFDNLDAPYGNASTLQTTTSVLQAFSEIQPDNKIVDGLRQWLVLSRQVQDWGKQRSTVETVDAILTSGTDWTNAARTDIPEFRLKGQRVQTPQSAVLTGAFTLTLDAGRASGKTLKITRSAPAPAWGGVISQYEAPIEDVKDAAIPNLSIRKETVALVDEGDGSLKPAKGITLKKGMKVRVTLAITNDRAMEYMAVTDERSACLEPTEQLSRYTSTDGVWYYKEVRDAATSIYIEYLPKGHHVISYECTVSQDGDFSCGIATIQSQYSPLVTAHTSGSLLQVR